MNEIDRHAGEGACKLLIGNNSDQPGRAVSTETAQAYADKLAAPFFETSVKEGTNVEEAFIALTKKMIETR